MSDIAREGLSGKVPHRYETRWVTFETDDQGRLLVRTLNGFKIIEDQEEAAAILKLITDAVGI